MQIPRKCKICEKKFIAKRENQFFCQRKCFRKDYYRRIREANAIKKYPTWKCPRCKLVKELDFDPVKFQKRFLQIHCDDCKYSQDEITKMEITVVEIVCNF